jgi:hypothetical protein
MLRLCSPRCLLWTGRADIGGSPQPSPPPLYRERIIYTDCAVWLSQEGTRDQLLLAHNSQVRNTYRAAPCVLDFDRF